MTTTVHTESFPSPRTSRLGLPLRDVLSHQLVGDIASDLGIKAKAGSKNPEGKMDTLRCAASIVGLLERTLPKEVLDHPLDLTQRASLKEQVLRIAQIRSNSAPLEAVRGIDHVCEWARKIGQAP